ncbi:MAG: hypothetical protein ACXAEF_11380 [Candidatus Thorarchaeota archaeon]
MFSGDSRKKVSMSTVQFYGVSASSIRSDIDTITGLQSGKKPIQSNETGMVSATSEVFGGVGGADCYCSGGSGDGELYCLLIIAVLLAVFAIVWTIVMVAFAIMTLGGFVRRRYRSKLFIQKENPEFLGKLAILSYRKGGVVNYSLNYLPYDEWVQGTFSLFRRKKYIRQVSIFFGFVWGAVEVLFKLYQLLFDPLFNYDLWPFRFVMVAIFLPLLLYSPFLELTIRGAFDQGAESVDRLLMEYPEYSPDTKMSFESPPTVIDRIPISVVRDAKDLTK